MGRGPTGIIPARAGFTRPASGPQPTPGDHPRACGVYVGYLAVGEDTWGSSPRVRGLRGNVMVIALRHGIIPARAGFTVITDAPERGGQDHPRACGVYLSNSPTTIMSIGSSPRVRGLLVRQLLRQIELRIIPARAGFTMRSASSRCPARDHPRACGVYLLRSCPGGSSAGSSPRVRGLPARPPVVAAGVRIIPARAGFTCPYGPAPGSRPDHPRACGVYGFSHAAHSVGSGSSPRVRGLPWYTRHRAGRFRDHPRACGVYLVRDQLGRVIGGSSPRVRGLRGRGRVPPRRLGIIPARAGFTAETEITEATEADHPRACGVYPLGVDDSHEPRGIIPARAGFTTPTATS